MNPLKIFIQYFFQTLSGFVKALIPRLEYLQPSLVGLFLVFFVLWRTSQGLDLVADMSQHYLSLPVLAYWWALTGYALVLWFIPNQIVKRPTSWQIWSWASYSKEERTLRTNTFGPSGMLYHNELLRMPRLIAALTLLTGGMIFIKYFRLVQAPMPGEVYSPEVLFAMLVLGFILGRNHFTDWVEATYLNNGERLIFVTAIVFVVSVLLPWGIEHFWGQNEWYLWALLLSNTAIALTLWMVLIVRTLPKPESLRFSWLRWSSSLTVKRVFWIYFVVLILVYSLCFVDPVQLQYTVPFPAALVLLIFSFLIIVWSMIYHFVLRSSFAGLLLMVIVVLAVKAFTPERNPYRVALLHQIKQKERPAFDAYARQWLERRASEESGPVPCFFVLAEGGGIRSAYWTAHLLAKLRDTLGSTAGKRIFALTGASGGAVGEAVYTALQWSGSSTSQVDKVDAIFNYNDFLTPALGVLFSRDWGYSIMSHFWNIKTEEDRGREIEETFEAAVLQSGDGVPLSMPLTAAVALDKPLFVPHATHVQSGRRAVISPVELPDTYDDRIIDVMDEITDTSDMRLITAGVLSARFPYISSGSEIKTGYQFVDGGYIDNFGAGNALAMLRRMYEIAGRLGINIRPFVTILSNNGFPAEDVSEVRDLNVPPKTLAELQANRTKNEMWKIKRYMKSIGYSNNILRFDLHRFKDNDPSVVYHFPLGWYLSDQAIEGIKRNLHHDFNRNNAILFDRLVRLMQ